MGMITVVQRIHHLGDIFVQAGLLHQRPYLLLNQGQLGRIHLLDLVIFINH